MGRGERLSPGRVARSGARLHAWAEGKGGEQGLSLGVPRGDALCLVPKGQVTLCFMLPLGLSTLHPPEGSGDSAEPPSETTGRGMGWAAEQGPWEQRKSCAWLRARMWHSLGPELSGSQAKPGPVGWTCPGGKPRQDK